MDLLTDTMGKIVLMLSLPKFALRQYCIQHKERPVKKRKALIL